MFKSLFDIIEEWLEAPQIVLDGAELLILCVLLLISGLIWFKSGKREE